ncbi:MAG: hypothetical protein OEZ38_12785, partial [Gammaproteobacteria bacterium]|nr:hypothetical protein [Gammaproteobacteria bacterium]
RPCIRQLKERITHSFYLEPFESGDIYEYLNFRMRAVGYRGPDIFNKKIADNIEKESKGLTRRINIIADKALLAAFSDGDYGVDKKHILIAAKDSEYGRVIGRRIYLSWLLVVLVAAVAFWAGSFMATKNDNGSDKNTGLVDKGSQVVALEDGLQKEESGLDNYLNTRMKDTLLWINSIDREKFSIQLAIVKVKSKDKLLMLVDSVKAKLDIHEVYIYKGKMRGSEVYSVLYGAFEDWGGASKQLSDLPEELRSNRPYIRNISDIKRSLKVD